MQEDAHVRKYVDRRYEGETHEPHTQLPTIVERSTAGISGSLLDLPAAVLGVANYGERLLGCSSRSLARRQAKNGFWQKACKFGTQDTQHDLQIISAADNISNTLYRKLDTHCSELSLRNLLMLLVCPHRRYHPCLLRTTDKTTLHQRVRDSATPTRTRHSLHVKLYADSRVDDVLQIELVVRAAVQILRFEKIRRLLAEITTITINARVRL